MHQKTCQDCGSYSYTPVCAVCDESRLRAEEVAPLWIEMLQQGWPVVNGSITADDLADV